MTKTERATLQMERWANDPAHGYDQQYRWGQRGDYDCSSAVITAWVFQVVFRSDRRGCIERIREVGNEAFAAEMRLSGSYNRPVKRK